MRRPLLRKMRSCLLLMLCLLLLQQYGATQATAGSRQMNPDDPQLNPTGVDSVATKTETFDHKTISGEEIKDIPEADLENLMQGRLSGLFIQNWTGSPGVQSVIAATAVNTTALGIDSKPLILVNDVPIYVDANVASGINPLSGYSAENIESIELLNDAASLARYGSRGANGVIKITTKNGKLLTETEISATALGGVNFKPELRNTISGNEERARLRGLYDNALVLPSNINGITLPYVLTDSLNTFFNHRSNWQEDDYATGAFQNYNLNIASGGSYGFFLLNLGFYDEEGAKIGTGLQRYSLNMDTRYNITNKLFMDVYMNAARLNRQRRDSNLFEPSFYPENDNRDLFPPTIFLADGAYRDVNSNNHLITSVSVQYNLNANFTFKTQIGIDYETGRRDYFIPSTLNDGRIFASSASTKRQRLINENTVRYFRTINNNDFNFTLGQSIIVTDNQFTMIEGERDAEGTSNFVSIVGSNFGLDNLDGRSSLQSNALLSFFADTDYEVLEGLVLRGVLRADGTSQLPENNRWKLYPALGAKWDVKLPFEGVSTSQLNVNLGTSGVLPAENFLYKSNLESAGDYGGLTGVVRFDEGNTGLTNPTATTLTAGVSLGVLQDKVQLSAEYINQTVKDYIYRVYTPTTAGFSPVYKNGIGVRNTGVNLTVSTQLTAGEFQWTSRLTGSLIANEVTDLPTDASQSQFGSLAVGKPLNGLYAFASSGHYATDDEVPVDPRTGNKLSYGGVEFAAGMPRILDKNGDFLLDEQDRYYVGSPQQNFYGGFGNTLSYKRLYLDALFSYGLGGQVLVESATNRYTSNLEDFDRGMFEATPGNTRYYTMQVNEDDHVSIQGIAAIESNSFVRLNNITLGYTIQSDKLGSIGVKSLKVFVTGKNLLLINQQYSGIDPEENWNAVHNYNLTSTGIPRFKSISCGVNLGL